MNTPFVNPKAESKADELLTVEINQTKTRIGFAVALTAISTIIVQLDPNSGLLVPLKVIFLVGFGEAILSFLSLVYLRRAGREFSQIRVLCWQIVDFANISFFLWAIGPYVQLLYPAYLWTILGNGVRYGLTNLRNATVMAAVGFLTIVVLGPFWSDHHLLATGFMIGLIILPSYFGVLIKRINDVRDQLVANEQSKVEMLVQLNDFKTNFFANISHEFRTPITLTLSALEFINQEAGQTSKHSEVIRRSQTRLLQLINQILDLEKIESGKLELKFRPIGSLRSFLEVRVNQFRQLAEKRGLALTEIPIEGPGPSPLYCDPEQFEKVIYNLLSNALKFTSAGSVAARSRIHDGFFEFIVQDTGVGIKADQMPLLFQRFKQASGSESKEFAGTGIGLSLVREIVELHGGTVKIESEYGKGTQIGVRIPLGRAHLKAHQFVETPYFDGDSEREAAEITQEGRSDTVGMAQHQASTRQLLTELKKSKSTILYVDDNFELREYVMEILARDYNVLLATDGVDALRVLDQVTPDLILSDLMMPQLDGAGLLKAVRERHGLNATPFVILTAKATISARNNLLQGGADDFLNKPFSQDELTIRIKNLLTIRKQGQALGRDIKNAEAIQRALMPAADVSLPGAQVAVLYLPCESLAGDFYDIIELKNSILLYVADVTSHGIASAQITFLIKTIFQNLVRSQPEADLTPAKVLESFAAEYRKFDLNYGVGLQVLNFNPATGKLIYASSNAPSPIVRLGGRMESTPAVPAPLIDGKLDQTGIFTDQTFTLALGDAIYCFTDGCTEFSPGFRVSAAERLMMASFRQSGASPTWREDLLAKLKEANGGSGKFADDITLLRLERPTN